MFDWKNWHSQHFQRIELALVNAIPAVEDPLDQLHPAMAYAVRAGGKRIRPLLIYATWQLGQTNPESLQDIEQVDSAAVAIELIHTYSLVHDDLPSMDNDDLRRGKPTTHKMFDEATALLVGDALQSEAFAIITQIHIPANLKVEMMQELSMSAGMHGMCKGQAIDLANVGKVLDLQTLEKMHRLKTGALLRCAIRMGASLGGLPQNQRDLLDQVAQDVGLGFQVTDDILDATQNSETLGKTAGKDEQANKPTFVSLMGLDASQRYAEELLTKSLEALTQWGPEADPLRAISKWAFTRKS
jgi:farnesyl diphosphate synthase